LAVLALYQRLVDHIAVLVVGTGLARQPGRVLRQPLPGQSAGVAQGESELIREIFIDGGIRLGNLGGEQRRTSFGCRGVAAAIQTFVQALANVAPVAQILRNPPQ